MCILDTTSQRVIPLKMIESCCFYTSFYLITQSTFVISHILLYYPFYIQLRNHEYLNVLNIVFLFNHLVQNWGKSDLRMNCLYFGPTAKVVTMWTQKWITCIPCIYLLLVSMESYKDLYSWHFILQKK